MVRDESLNNLQLFQKGVSGNPKGKPKGAKSRKSLARKWLTAIEHAKNPITKEYEDLSQEDMMMLSMIYAVKAKQDVKAFEALMDMRFGKQATKEESKAANPTTPEGYAPFTIVDPANTEVIEIEIGADQ